MLLVRANGRVVWRHVLHLGLELVGVSAPALHWPGREKMYFLSGKHTIRRMPERNRVNVWIALTADVGDVGYGWKT